MKLILTESQINQLVLFEQASFLLNEIICEEKNLEAVKKRIKQMIIGGVSLAAIIYGIEKSNLMDNIKQQLIQFTKEEVQVEQEEDTLANDPIFNEKIDAVEEYMRIALANQNFTLNDTQLTAEALVRASYEHNFDLPLLVAAAHLESCFGATPRARRTNSVYSVGLYDNGKNAITYSHPNESINGYIRLMTSDYLIKGKTINDLLKPGQFVNKNGHRYASAKNYENKLRSIRNKIKRNYPILT